MKFQTLLDNVNENNFPKNIKKIYTSVGIWKDEVFKAWVSQNIKRILLLVTQDNMAVTMDLHILMFLKIMKLKLVMHIFLGDEG